MQSCFGEDLYLNTLNYKALDPGELNHIHLMTKGWYISKANWVKKILRIVSFVCFSGELNETINCFCHLLSFTTFIEQMSCYLCLLTGKLESEPFWKNTPYLLTTKLIKDLFRKNWTRTVLKFWLFTVLAKSYGQFSASILKFFNR